MQNKIVGKLKKTLKKTCPECSEANLEVRSVFDTSSGTSEMRKDVLSCPSCGYTTDFGHKKKDIQKIKKFHEEHQE